MENTELSKTSDEIINELFSSLNVPLSPKPVGVEEWIIKGEQVSVHTGDSDNSEDEESDSKTSESDIETKTTTGEVQEDSKTDKVEKVKSQKKKKDKRKKKKKHKKKEDGGRHKHKKKKKRESYETAEEAKLAADVLQDVKVKNQAFIQKIIQEEFRQLDVGHGKTKETRESKSRSPKLHRGSKSPDVPDEVDDVDEKKSRQKLLLQSNCKEDLSERTLDSSSPSLRVTEYSSKDESCVPFLKVEESASKSAAKCNPSHEMSLGSEPENDPTQTYPTVSDSCKRKQSPHSHSPSPACTKKLKSSHSSSSSKSSSPKTDFGYRSPSRSGSAKDSKSDCESKGRSRSRSRKRSKSERSSSRTRSVSESRKSGSGELKRSRSRSKKRSRSRSKKRSRSRSRKRSRSKKRSRSRSDSELRSRSKSKRKSRSESRNRSRSRSRKRSASKSRKSSQSKSRKSRSKERSKSRSRRSKSHSRRESSSKTRRSRGRSKSKSRRSRSRSHSRRSGSKSRKQSHSKSSRSQSRRKSRSRSRRRSRSRSTHKTSPAKERFDMFTVMRERASRLAELKSQGIPDGSLGSLLLSSVQSLPLPAPDPSSIPLPHTDSFPTDSLKDEIKEEGNAEMEESKTSDNAVGENHVNLSLEDQEASKPREASRDKQEEGSEKSKAKTIITIKSLKDSIVFQQAQEEAERKAKENVHLYVDTEKRISNAEQHRQQETNDQQKGTEQDELVSLIGKRVDSDICRKDISEESDRRKEEKKEKGEEKRKDEEQQRRETQTETESVIAKRQTEIETEETENIHSKEEKQVKAGEIYTKKKTVDKHEDKEDSIGDNHLYIEEKEKRRENKQSCKTGEEEDKGKLLSKADSEEEAGNKQSSKSKEKESKERKVSSKREEKEETRKNKYSKAEEEKGKGRKHSFSAEEDEDVKITSSHKCEEKDKVKKRSSKVGKKDGESKARVSCKPFEKEDESIVKQPIETEKIEESNEGKSHSNDESGKNGLAHPAQDSADKMEEGEIVSDKEVEVKPSSKTHSKKKSKKDKSSTKEKKKSHKDKSKHKDERKKACEKKKEQERARSRSKDKRRSRQQSSSKDHSHSRRHWRRSRSRSRSWSRSHSRDRSSRQHRRSHSRSRSRSRSKRRRESTSDLRDKVTRKRLLEIARRNAVYLMQNGCLPPSVEQEQLVKIKAGGKSVDELTDFCKQLVASGNYSDVDVSEPSMSSEEENNSEKPFSSTRHPFSVRDSKPILMNIRNAPMLPTKTNAERLAGQAKLREQFPVSSGSQHRTKGEMSSSDGKHLSESEWVPVPPKEKKEEDKVFTRPEVPPVDISQIVSTRLSAMRKLQDNPNDSEAIKTLNNVQKEMQNWALSKQEPGQFTGTTGVKVLSQEELSSGHQAWARKEQFKEAAPVRPQFGLKMLQKMGWSPGEGLGKNKEGTTEPLLLDVKMDKKGFHAQEEVTPKKQPVPLVKDLSGKHPVSALVELCSKRKWSPPDFEMVFDCGPDHKKNFLMKVMVNGQEFKPSVAASTKKMAKANAAAAYLQSLGLYPKDPHYPL